MGKRNILDKRTSAKVDSIIADILAYVLVVALFVAFPLYFHNGYEVIATYKYSFFMTTAKYAGIIFPAYLVVHFILSGNLKSNAGRTKSSFSIVVWTSLYLSSNLITLLLSEYKIINKDVKSSVVTFFTDGAFYGISGWYGGFFTLALVTFCMMLIAYLLKRTDYIFIPILMALTIISIWGSLNRYGIYPIKMIYQSETFISSLGNIDWFSGYISLLLPIAYGLYLISTNTRNKIFYMTISFIVTFTTVVDGAESGIFALLVTFLLSLGYSLKNYSRLRRFTDLVTVFGISLLIAALIDIIFSQARNFKSELVDLMLSLPFAIFVLLLAIASYIFLNQVKKEKILYPGLFIKHGQLLVLVTSLGVVFLLLIIITINTVSGGKLPLIGNSQYFIFSKNWGSNRGAAYWMAVKTYSKQPFIHKIFGVGQDAFKYVAYEIDEVAKISREYFWKLKLTNAHNELLNTLVNEGILGVISLVGMWVMVFKALYKNLSKEPRLIVFILSFGAYLANNIFSFRNIISFPLVYGLLGICISMLATASKVDKTGAKD